MSSKRKRGEGGGAPRQAATPRQQPERASVGQQTSHIRNKLVRAELYAKLKHKQKKQKKADRKKRAVEEAKAEQLGLEPPPRQKQKTLENTREKDVTMVEEGDEEVQLDEADDEFAAHFARQREPKVLVTTCYKPSKGMYAFLSEMLGVLPCAQYYKRAGFPLKKIVAFAGARDFSDLLVFNEDRKEVNGLLHVHLPDGPTAHYRLSSLVLGRDIKGHGRPSSHRPELILNGFGTRLGRRVGRMLGSLFHQDPQFRGRRVATFHNQRDFIFFRAASSGWALPLRLPRGPARRLTSCGASSRPGGARRRPAHLPAWLRAWPGPASPGAPPGRHHRYIFEQKERKDRETGKRAAVVQTRMQELGPRFTLKLQSLQKGTFDSRHGEFEWVHKHDMDTSRRRFHL